MNTINSVSTFLLKFERPDLIKLQIACEEHLLLFMTENFQIYKEEILHICIFC